MKLFSILIAAMFFFLSCQSGSEQKKQEQSQSVSPVIAEKKVKRLEPSDIDLQTPVDAIEANFQINCWENKIVELAGYGYVFWGDSLDTKSGITLTDSMGGSRKLISASFASSPAQNKIAKNAMIHLRGRINGNFNDAIRLDSCEVIAIAPAISTQAVDPFSKPLMNAVSFHSDYFKWQGKEIAILGDYYMTTTSTTSFGKTIRVDLKNSANSKKVAGCEFAADPTEKIRVNEKGVIIRGRISTYTPYGILALENCSLVNR